MAAPLPLLIMLACGGAPHLTSSYRTLLKPLTTKGCLDADVATLHRTQQVHGGALLVDACEGTKSPQLWPGLP